MELTLTDMEAYTGGVICVSAADHLMNYIIFGQKHVTNTHRYLNTRKLYIINQSKLLTEFRNVPWHILSMFGEVDDYYNVCRCYRTSLPT